MLKTTRRALLGYGVALLPLSLLPTPGKEWSAKASGMTPYPDDFMHISSVLTGHKDLDDSLGNRVWQALTEKDGTFPQRYNRLRASLTENNIGQSSDYATSKTREDKTLHAIAVDIVGAWYLGRVGPVLPRSETGTPAFITYGGALMWRPTLDATVIPTYSRGGPGFWAEPPSTLSTD